MRVILREFNSEFLCLTPLLFKKNLFYYPFISIVYLYNPFTLPLSLFRNSTLNYLLLLLYSYFLTEFFKKLHILFVSMWVLKGVVCHLLKTPLAYVCFCFLFYSTSFFVSICGLLLLLLCFIEASFRWVIVPVYCFKLNKIHMLLLSQKKKYM